MYNLLNGIRVLECADLGPSGVGGHLGDMGAEVIKIEPVPKGVALRAQGEFTVRGEPVGYLHLNLNRNKKSVGLNLKDPAGRDIFLELAKTADVVIEGFRYGTLDRLGVGYEALRAINPSIVFCSQSGYGHGTLYEKTGSHAPGFDAYAGLLPPPFDDEGYSHMPTWIPVGFHAANLFAAMGVAAALVRAKQTGEGSFVEVASVDAAACWAPEKLDQYMNPTKSERGITHLEDGQLSMWPLMEYYATSDGKVVFFQAIEDKFWENFCRLIDREELLTDFPRAFEDRTGEPSNALWLILRDVFRQKTAAEWQELFEKHDVAYGPVYSFEELSEDPHFRARCVYDVEYPGVGTLTLSGTPVNVEGQVFNPPLAPFYSEHSDQVLGEILGIKGEKFDELVANGVVARP